MFIDVVFHQHGFCPKGSYTIPVCRLDLSFLSPQLLGSHLGHLYRLCFSFVTFLDVFVCKIFRKHCFAPVFQGLSTESSLKASFAPRLVQKEAFEPYPKTIYWYKEKCCQNLQNVSSRPSNTILFFVKGILFLGVFKGAKTFEARNKYKKKLHLQHGTQAETLVNQAVVALPLTNDPPMAPPLQEERSDDAPSPHERSLGTRTEQQVLFAVFAGR